MPKRLTVSLKRAPAMRVTKVSIGDMRLCYILVANKKIRYSDGRSRIVYIGTTKKGLSRISQSVAARAEDVLAIHGVDEFKARVVTCRRRQNVKSWHKLERALLLVFREMFGEVPLLNTHGKNITEVNEFELFAKSRINTIIEDVG